MLRILRKKKFEADIHLAKRRGKDFKKLKIVLDFLANQSPLPLRYRDHGLKGKFGDYRECHIEPDWLLYLARA